MKKTILLISTLSVLLTGCGENYTDEAEKPKIGYNDIVHKELYSFEGVVSEDDYNTTLDSYALECEGNNGVLIDEITDKEKGLIYSSFICVEQY